jgi:uncharacterized protein (TIGR01244 family)
MKQLFLIVIVGILASPGSWALRLPQTGRERLDQIEQALQTDVPRLLCLADGLATGAQPNDQAFSKLAENGFRTVLNLRTASEGADLEKERKLVEQSGMRYINIPVVAKAPRAEQADEFIRVVKEKANHPMLIHCRSASRVGAFMMIYRVLQQGWSEEKAEEEAVRIGLHTEELRKFAKDYIHQHKGKRR